MKLDKDTETKIKVVVIMLGVIVGIILLGMTD